MASITQTEMKANYLLRKHGLAALGWTFKFDNARKRGGQCDYTHKRISVSRHLVPLWTDDAVEQTLFHEIAHALVGHGAGHGSMWLSQARVLGYTGGRLHSEPTVKGAWLTKCPIHGVGTRRYHRRAKLTCRRCRLQTGRIVPLSYVAA